MKIEYPKWIYHDTLPALIVKDREAHLVKQKEGYHEHDGKLIEDDAIERIAEEMKEEIKNEDKPAEPEITFTKSESHEKRKAGRPKRVK